MKTSLRSILVIFMFALSAAAQDPVGFDSKFFEDLRKLFGQLEQSELTRAFDRAQSIRCSELVSQTGEWREVAFLNDDRKLSNWHHDKIEDVKRDPSKFVFSGQCPSESGPVKVSSSFPVMETFGRSKLTMQDNDPVSAFFEPRTGAYTFELPYLYLESKDGKGGSIYTLAPPLLSSRPSKDVTEEFRCKSLGDRDLTYRFLLCRIRVINSDPHLQQRPAAQQPLGSAAYYILSDGKEASSSVKLSFGDGTPVTKEPTPRQPDAPRPTAEPAWQAAAPQTLLLKVAEGEFRLRFDSRAWSDRVRSAQFMVNRRISASLDDQKVQHCAWRPESAGAIDLEATVFSLRFKKDLQTGTSAIFDLETLGGSHTASLECYFPQSENPAGITVDQLQTIVGSNITLEVRR